MGNCCLPTRFRRTSSAVNPKNITLLLLGLDNSGKTTIAKRLAGEPIDSVVPTVGFSVILLRQKNCHVSIYDLGGGPQIRDIWPRYYGDAHGVIFVIDAHDVQKLEECREILQKLLRHEQISGKPVLLLANKQDADGALDEIDIVDRLDLERLVNEQKCPTLVELCSALNFSKKIDEGIDNGYKYTILYKYKIPAILGDRVTIRLGFRWLIRSVVRDYPLLNNRVLKDLAKQEEANRVQVIRRQSRKAKWGMGDGEDLILGDEMQGNPFMPIQKVLEGGHPNGIITKSGKKTIARIPGTVEDFQEKTTARKSQIHRFLGEEIVSVPEPARDTPNSYCSEFFIFEQFQSDLELLNEVANQSIRNFLVRPKSSGARLYGIRTEKKKTTRRKPLRKLNKTGPAPFSDISNDVRRVEDVHRKPSGQSSLENINPFVIGGLLGSKSMPNSRRNSVSNRKRRHSMANGKLQSMELSSLKVSNRLPSTKEILLDVNKLSKF